jgi:hypothetical protein
MAIRANITDCGRLEFVNEDMGIYIKIYIINVSKNFKHGIYEDMVR